VDTIIKHYEDYDEDIRLVKDSAHTIEFVTTTHFLDKYINKNARVLEVGAGAGRYAFFYGEKGVRVTAVDLSPKHVSIMEDKAKGKELTMEILQGNALNMDFAENESFDVVLCLGPLYHLMNEQDREKCIRECIRVLKPNGVLAVAYISRYATFINMIIRNTSSINDLTLRNIPRMGKEFDDARDCFYHSTYKEIEQLMKENKVIKLEHIGTDGIGGTLRDITNKFNEAEFQYWMEYHFETCKDESLIGYSQHGLFIGKKEGYKA